jgi:hypothetical protein
MVNHHAFFLLRRKSYRAKVSITLVMGSTETLVMAVSREKTPRFHASGCVYFGLGCLVLLSWWRRRLGEIYMWLGGPGGNCKLFQEGSAGLDGRYGQDRQGNLRDICGRELCMIPVHSVRLQSPSRSTRALLAAMASLSCVFQEVQIGVKAM